MTVEEAINEFRLQLKDTGSLPRWKDEEVVTYLNNALRDLNKRRPDAFFTEYGVPATEVPAALTLSSGDIEINDFFEEPFIHYACYRALTRDSDDPANTQQVGFFLQLYKAGIS